MVLYAWVIVNVHWVGWRNWNVFKVTGTGHEALQRRVGHLASG